MLDTYRRNDNRCSDKDARKIRRRKDAGRKEEA